MATATWFDYKAYMANKLAQVNAIDPEVQYTPETFKAEFEKAGYVGEEGAFKHFQEYGNKEEVAPNALFNADEYIAAKAADFYKTAEPTASNIAEVTKAFADGGMSAWDHYVTYGSSEGVEPSFEFNTNAYLTAKAAALNTGKYDGKENWTAEDVAAAIKASGSTVLEHFMANGGNGELEVAESYEDVIKEGAQNPFVDPTPPTPKPDPGNTYALTTKVDAFTGTDRADLFTGMTSSVGTEKTLNEGDKLDGGEGIDTLKVAMKSSFNGFTGEGKMANVEQVDLTSEGTTSVNFSAKGSTGIDTYTLHSSKAAINLTDVDSTEITVNVDGLKSGATSIGFASKVADGKADLMGLGLNNVGTVAEGKTAEAAVAITAKGIEGLAIEATGVNVVDLSAAATESITAEGDGSLKVTKVNAGIETFNAAEVKGNVVADLSGATLEDLQGGAGDDTFTVTGLTKTANISGGIGNDTLVLKGMGGTVQPTLSGFENVRVDGTSSNLVFSAENSTDFTGLELADNANVTLADVDASEFTITSFGKATGAQGGSVTITSATDLVYNTVANTKTVEAKGTGDVSTAVTATDATSATINVGANTKASGTFSFGKAEAVTVNVASAMGKDGKTEQTSFNSTLTADKAQILTVNAEGMLGTKTAFSVKAAESVNVTAGQGGTAAISAGNATTVNITAGAALSLTGSDFAKAETITLAQNKGALTSTNDLDFGVIKDLTVSGTGSTSAITVGNLGSSTLENGVTVTASGLKAGFVAQGVRTAAEQDITLDVSNVTGGAKFGAISVANKTGSVTVTANGLGGKLDLGAISADTIVVEARKAQGAIEIDSLAGDVITFDATGYLGSTIDVGTITVGEELTFSGAALTANAAKIDIDGTDITAFLQGGLAADVFTFEGFTQTTAAQKLTLTGDLGGEADTINVDLSVQQSAGDIVLDFKGIAGVDKVSVSGINAAMSGANFTYYGVDGSDAIDLGAVDLFGTGKVSIDLFANDGVKDVVNFGSAVAGGATTADAFEISGFESGTDVLQFAQQLLKNVSGATTAASIEFIETSKFDVTFATQTGSKAGFIQITSESGVVGTDANSAWAAIAGGSDAEISNASVSAAKLIFLVDDGTDTFLWYYSSDNDTASVGDIKLLGKVNGTDFDTADFDVLAP